MRALVGPEPGDDKEVRIRNRIVKCKGDHITYEGDEKHARAIVDELRLHGESKAVDGPLPKEYDAPEDDLLLETEEAKRYRKLAATVRYLPLDGPDLQFSASVLGRKAARPMVRS